MLKPIGNFVLVKNAEVKEKSSSGLIHFPETAQTKDGVAEVVEVSDGVYLEDGTLRPLRVKVGDTVLYDRFSGVETKMDGQVYLILRETEIYGVLS